MSTDTENAQAAAEGYWPVEGYEAHGIDAHGMKTLVKDFIARHSTPAGAAPAIESASPSAVLAAPKAPTPPLVEG